MTLFRPAQRTQAKLRLAIDGPSGSGKTYSALLIAKGLAGGDLSKVALIDTERGSGSLYADLGAYSVLDFEPPYTVKRFVQAHDAAVAEGFSVIVVDSLTHFWSGEGGILDAVDKIAAAQTSGNSFAAWKKGTPLQKQFMDTMLASQVHIIATMRSKTEWVLEENDKGKKVPRKVGLAPDQRKDVDYEFTLVLDLSREHIAQASKDRTGLWDDRLEIPGPKHGEELAAWLGSAAPVQLPRQVLRDEQAESHPVPQGNSEPAQSGQSGNGHISENQARQLFENLFSKGKDAKWFLERLATQGVGDGEHLTSIPSGRYEEVLAIVRSFPDPAPPQREEPPAAQPAEPAPSAQEPSAEQAAPAAAPEPAKAEGNEIGMDAAAYRAKRSADAAASAPKPRKKGTITDAQLTCLGALCSDLESEGVPRDEWRLMMFKKEGVSSRTELTKAAASRTIDYVKRWVTDVKTGIVAPHEKVA